MCLLKVLLQTFVDIYHLFTFISNLHLLDYNQLQKCWDTSPYRAFCIVFVAIIVAQVALILWTSYCCRIFRRPLHLYTPHVYHRSLCTSALACTCKMVAFYHGYHWFLVCCSSFYSTLRLNSFVNDNFYIIQKLLRLFEFHKTGWVYRDQFVPYPRQSMLIYRTQIVFTTTTLKGAVGEDWGTTLKQ